MKKSYTLNSAVLVYSLTLFSFLSINAQNNSEIIDAYEDYTEAPREISYVHLNKSTYIEGEMMGFTAYVFDKFTKSLSKTTVNLYCTISDSTNKVIKKKLIKVNNGTSSNIFNIDSLFTSGKYTFKAYTNWMLNFKEPNYFEQQFFVIGPDIQSEVKTTKRETNFDIQVLPEGGHLLANVQNSIGIIVKNSLGIGLANATGKILDQNNVVITTFKLNRFGITKSLISPKTTDSYKIVVTNDTEEITATINPAEAMGINMSLNQLKNNVILSLRTNHLTNETLKNEDYTLVIHNGHQINEFLFNFKTENEITKTINTESLSSGINIFTVFDKHKTPILERLYFNYKNIQQTKSNVISTTQFKDSLNLKLKLFAAIDTKKINTVSISVLPSETKSYNKNSSILSKVYLEPYIKGFIQNPSYYFTNNTAEAQYNLDHLLLTQGWSSYNWNNIFNAPPSYTHNFENGINTIVNINEKNKQGVYISSALKHKKSEMFVLTEVDSTFNQTRLYPEDKESYKIYRTNNKQSKKLHLHVQYMPSTIPLFNLNISTPNNAFIGMDFKPLETTTMKPAWNNKGIQALDEVLVTTDIKEKTRIMKIKANTFGQVNFIDDATRNNAETIATYLSKFGYRVTTKQGSLQIYDRRTNKKPIVFLDGMALQTGNLYPLTNNYQMTYVDYIELNKNGLGADRIAAGMNEEAGGAGYIKIVTDPIRFARRENSNISSLSEHKFPLTFSSSKKFYVPSYKNYNSTFFKEYGTLAWLPDVKPNHNGILDFKIYNTYTSSLNLYIEGVLNDGTYISEIKTIELDNQSN
jgi:hypothetical protein